MEVLQPMEVFEPISLKNLSILEEQLSRESLMISKLRQYSRQCMDPELKNLCSNLAEKHKNHYETLINYVLSHSSDS
jgi:hypothetical protein